MYHVHLQRLWVTLPAVLVLRLLHSSALTLFDFVAERGQEVLLFGLLLFGLY